MTQQNSPPRWLLFANQFGISLSFPWFYQMVNNLSSFIEGNHLDWLLQKPYYKNVFLLEDFITFVTCDTICDNIFGIILGINCKSLRYFIQTVISHFSFLKCIFIREERNQIQLLYRNYNIEITIRMLAIWHSKSDSSNRLW